MRTYVNNIFFCRIGTLKFTEFHIFRSKQIINIYVVKVSKFNYSLKDLHYTFLNHQNIFSIRKNLKFKKFEASKNKISQEQIKMESPKMTSKLMQQLLIKRYGHFKFFLPISDRKIKFQLQIKHIVLTSRVLADKESCVAAALETAKLISEKSPVAVQTTKESLNYSRDHPIKDSLNHVVRSTNMYLLIIFLYHSIS